MLSGEQHELSLLPGRAAPHTVRPRMAEPANPNPAYSRGEKHFRWRRTDVSRVEGLSDGVFALALTLLVVSLDVPQSFDALLDSFKQVPVFLLTYSMFGWIWYRHCQFHRRFGLEDRTTAVWNLVLLFVVLLYVYPLRYLAAALCEMFGIVRPKVPLAAEEVATGLRGADMQTLMILYGIGFVALMGVIAMLYRHAWKLRDGLGLDARERILTRAALRESTLTGCIGLLSIGIASLGAWNTWQFLSGITYSLIGPMHGWSGATHGTRAEGHRRSGGRGRSLNVPRAAGQGPTRPEWTTSFVTRPSTSTAET